jgi:DNA-binding transcriptional LysR family regulator
VSVKKNDWLRLEDCPPSLLHTLVAFADQGSVSKAAIALDLDQPIVSRRIKGFIDCHDSGGGLLERVGARRLRLTERGKASLPKIREVLSRYDDLLAHLRGRQQAQEVVRAAVGSFSARLYFYCVCHVR